MRLNEPPQQQVPQLTGGTEATWQPLCEGMPDPQQLRIHEFQTSASLGLPGSSNTGRHYFRKPVTYWDTCIAPVEGRDPDFKGLWAPKGSSNGAQIWSFLPCQKAFRTALHLACAIGFPDVVCLLVARHCQLNGCDNNSNTPLIKAVQCQQEECVSILLLHGADPNMVDESSSSALHYAAAGGNLRIVERLLESKANMEARDELKANFLNPKGLYQLRWKSSHVGFPCLRIPMFLEAFLYGKPLKIILGSSLIALCNCDIFFVLGGMGTPVAW
ncbi:ankyrin repeat and KH domain-containing protein mask-like [Monodelphis domestica]|uniref:ankyrin repeat and KH domain-containing protein mask-like n=1 Tax=Monodelphis domestica TaxID=13616 RepID=UPI0024E1D1A0|nr:ankyrin repeat and KH domain-containing protein mask-like [Monodelphis domestica]